MEDTVNSSVLGCARDRESSEMAKPGFNVLCGQEEKEQPSLVGCWSLSALVARAKSFFGKSQCVKYYLDSMHLFTCVTPERKILHVGRLVAPAAS